MKKEHSFTSPIGTITVSCDDDGNAITSIHLRGKTSESAEPVCSLLKDAECQFGEYFSGLRKSFDLPLTPRGTDFQKQVWNALMEIPYGETRTYGEIAASIGNSKASRAVGMANNKNPLMIIVPCHRVVGSDGSLTGYAGGLGAKEFLLKLEMGNTDPIHSIGSSKPYKSNCTTTGLWSEYPESEES